MRPRTRITLLTPNGRTPTRGGHNKLLSEAQEEALTVYLDRCIFLGRPSKKRDLQAAVNSILRNSGSEKIVSKIWTSRFLRRHPQYQKRRTKPLSTERIAAQEREQISLHFDKFQRAMDIYKFQKEDIWNFDETGFRIGCLRGQLVLTHTNQKAVYIADPENRESITIIESISGDGCTIDPMVIMQGVIMKEKHFNNSLSESVLMGVSETGFTNDQLSLAFIRHFDEQTRKKHRHLE